MATNLRVFSTIKFCASTVSLLWKVTIRYASVCHAATPCCWLTWPHTQVKWERIIYFNILISAMTTQSSFSFQLWPHSHNMGELISLAQQQTSALKKLCYLVKSATNHTIRIWHSQLLLKERCFNEVSVCYYGCWHTHVMSWEPNRKREFLRWYKQTHKKTPQK